MRLYFYLIGSLVLYYISIAYSIVSAYTPPSANLFEISRDTEAIISGDSTIFKTPQGIAIIKNENMRHMQGNYYYGDNRNTATTLSGEKNNFIIYEKMYHCDNDNIKSNYFNLEEKKNNFQKIKDLLLKDKLQTACGLMEYTKSIKYIPSAIKTRFEKSTNNIDYSKLLKKNILKSVSLGSGDSSILGSNIIQYKGYLNYSTYTITRLSDQKKITFLNPFINYTGTIYMSEADINGTAITSQDLIDLKDPGKNIKQLLLYKYGNNGYERIAFVIINFDKNTYKTFLQKDDQTNYVMYKDYIIGGSCNNIQIYNIKTDSSKHIVSSGNGSGVYCSFRSDNKGPYMVVSKQKILFPSVDGHQIGGHQIQKENENEKNEKIYHFLIDIDKSKTIFKKQ